MGMKIADHRTKSPLSVLLLLLKFSFLIITKGEIIVNKGKKKQGHKKALPKKCFFLCGFRLWQMRINGYFSWLC